FLSGGQDHLAATSHLNAINRLTTPKPWTLTFSYGRALQTEALLEWRGRPGNVKTAQAAFTHRARCCSAAALGRYTPALEREPAAVRVPVARRKHPPPATSDLPLSLEDLDSIHAYWRACNSLAVGMIYLQDTPLLREPLKPEHIKRRLLGHWGASPALSFVWVHL